MEAKDILGLDVGLKRTGIARASNIARIAEPLMTVLTDNTLNVIAEYTNVHKVEAIAVGLPRNLSNEDTEQTNWVREWVDRAKAKIDTPLYWQDEALTTVKAETIKLKAKNADIDSIAAGVILQDFLDTPEAKRVVC